MKRLTPKNTVIVITLFLLALPAQAAVVVHTVSGLVDAVNATASGTTTLLTHNVLNAAAGWFKDTQAGDLHLQAERAGVTDAAYSLIGLTDDFDSQHRPLGPGPDIGADEFSKTGPDPSKNPTLGWLFLLTGDTL